MHKYERTTKSLKAFYSKDICVQCTRSHFYVFVWRWYLVQKTKTTPNTRTERTRENESRKTASVSVHNRLCFSFKHPVENVCSKHTHKYTLNRMPFLSLSHQFHFFLRSPQPSHRFCVRCVRICDSFYLFFLNLVMVGVVVVFRLLHLIVDVIRCTCSSYSFISRECVRALALSCR